VIKMPYADAEKQKAAVQEAQKKYREKKRIELAEKAKKIRERKNDEFQALIEANKKAVTDIKSLTEVLFNKNTEYKLFQAIFKETYPREFEIISKKWREKLREQTNQLGDKKI
jgi:hypothetical protein